MDRMLRFLLLSDAVVLTHLLESSLNRTAMHLHTLRKDACTAMILTALLQSISKAISSAQMELVGLQMTAPCTWRILSRRFVPIPVYIYGVRKKYSTNCWFFKVIWAYDFDAVLGVISNKRIFIDRQDHEGNPDGLLVDVEGNVYTFLWEGSKVEKYDTEARLLRSWSINAWRVTHGAWCGNKYDQLILTSASDDKPPKWEGEEAGALFWLKDVGVKGLEKHKFAKLITAWGGFPCNYGSEAQLAASYKNRTSSLQFEYLIMLIVSL